MTKTTKTWQEDFEEFIDNQDGIIPRANPFYFELEQFISAQITQAEKWERERVVTEIRKSKVWELVPNTPRMIMISDSNFEDLLKKLNKEK